MTAERDAAAVVRALAAPALTVDVVLARRDLLPPQPGFYAWWARRGAIADVPHLPHPLDERLGLFYVGISPKRQSSKQNIRKRVIGNHLRGNTGSSTFRFVLAALLLDELDLAPAMRGDKTVLDGDGNGKLSDWQRRNLSITWCVRPRPWEIEDEVIALMQPPLNCAHNETHPFYPRVRDARARFRRRAVATAA